MRTIALTIAALLMLAAAPAAATDPLSDDPFPVGACAKVTSVDRRPICVMVDPSP